MRNQKRTLCILLLVLLLLILLIIFVIPNLGKTPPNTTADNRIYLCPIERTDIQRLAYTTSEGTRTLTYSDDGWSYADGTAESQEVVTNLLAAVSGLYSTQLAYSGSEYLSDCGFDSPELIITVSGAAESVTLTVGAYNNALDRWYCIVNGSTDIYLIGNNLATRFGINH